LGSFWIKHLAVGGFFEEHLAVGGFSLGGVEFKVLASKSKKERLMLHMNDPDEKKNYNFCY